MDKEKRESRKRAISKTALDSDPEDIDQDDDLVIDEMKQDQQITPIHSNPRIKKRKLNLDAKSAQKKQHKKEKKKNC